MATDGIDFFSIPIFMIKASIYLFNIISVMVELVTIFWKILNDKWHGKKFSSSQHHCNEIYLTIWMEIYTAIAVCVLSKVG